VKAVLLWRVVRQLEQVRDRLSLAEPQAGVILDRDGVVHWSTRVEREDPEHPQAQACVGMNDKRELLEATAEWLIGEAGKITKNTKGE